MDKEGQAVEGLDMLGFGFIEVGTFTARAQGGNDKPRMWRYPQMRAVRNRMGFNNSGADEAAKRLRALRRTPRGRSIVVGANIGKTKVTPLEDAVEDYRYSANAVARWVDYLVVNVSSPNTPGCAACRALRHCARSWRRCARPRTTLREGMSRSWSRSPRTLPMRISTPSPTWSWI